MIDGYAFLRAVEVRCPLPKKYKDKRPLLRLREDGLPGLQLEFFLVNYNNDHGTKYTGWFDVTIDPEDFACSVEDLLDDISEVLRDTDFAKHLDTMESE